MKIFDSMLREKVEFEPLESGKVRMYVCGPTVYNFFHIGNARPFITFDTLRRYFEYRGYDVTYVQNFTDIDDKMINRANIEGISVNELAERFIAEYYIDADKLNIKRATFQPRATETIPEIIELISMLIEKNHAYVSDDGVYFDVMSYPEYGHLSHQNLNDLEAGASERVAVDENKRSPLDFVLWKFKKPDEPFWPSPWGDGRPGWHIECSAMNHKFLGDTIDIHGGGQDLAFPHHENEIAQSEAATGKTFVRYWMHNGFINVDNEKMSKSTGNLFTVRDIAQEFEYPVMRFFLLTGHYRMPINFSADLLHAAENGLQRIRTSVENLVFLQQSAPPTAADSGAQAAESELKQAIDQAKADFIASMDDDLNTPDALAAIFELVRAANTAATIKGLSVSSLAAAEAMIRELTGVLGLEFEAPAAIPSEITALVEARAAAKKARDFQEADRIRAEINSKGFIVEDTPQGPKITQA
jgi:cysteinyl-tRNA synthetase